MNTEKLLKNINAKLSRMYKKNNDLNIIKEYCKPRFSPFIFEEFQKKIIKKQNDL